VELYTTLMILWFFLSIIFNFRLQIAARSRWTRKWNYY